MSARSIVISIVAKCAGVLAAVFYVLWQLLAEQKLFLHTFLVERVGNPIVPRLPLGYWNVLQLKLIMLWQQLRNNPEALKASQYKIYQRMLERLAARGAVRNQILKIEEYEADSLKPEDFYKRNVKRGVPCVIRGFHKEATVHWGLRSLSERFPGAVAQVLDRRDRKIKSVKLKEVYADQRQNFIPQQALLDQNKEMRDFFDIQRSHSYFPVLGKATKPVASFLILGFGKGLNANYHCEESPNWYMAVSGSKRWTLVEAEYSWLLYPAARGDGMRRFSEFMADAEGNPREKEKFALFEYAPKYEFELHPGDILFFPAWMWHKTINLHDEGLGVTCRYTAPVVVSNRYFRALQMISPDFWRSIVQVVAGMVRNDSGGLEEAGSYNEQEVILY